MTEDQMVRRHFRVPRVLSISSLIVSQTKPYTPTIPTNMMQTPHAIICRFRIRIRYSSNSLWLFSDFSVRSVASVARDYFELTASKSACVRVSIASSVNSSQARA